VAARAEASGNGTRKMPAKKMAIAHPVARPMILSTPWILEEEHVDILNLRFAVNQK
jgi:hypothetical protein